MIIPSKAWKKNRDRMVKRSLSHLHLTEVNPGPDSFKLRYDYIATRADIVKVIEDIMLDTERLCKYYYTHSNA
jgi:hypothetical protein